ncbi:MAG TPA: hypothetical protein VFX00_02160 [Pedococcus sp.]|jgi:8-oxo-dGTP pyrophosphatase MutT (NUDIX family)|nr:hypothetical protein [Pedococcus sp.]
MAASSSTKSVRSVVESTAGAFGLDRRRVPGRRGLLDWLVVAPGGVFVVDEHAPQEERSVAIRTRQDRDVADNEGWHLLVDGTDHPHLLLGVQTRAAAVREALEAAGIASWGVVVPVVCFQGATLPRLRRCLTAGRTFVVGPRGLAELLRRSGTLDERERTRIRDLFDDAFPTGLAVA